MRIEIEDPQNLHLKHVYCFNTFDLTVVFTGFKIMEKPSGKRKWTITKYWDKYMTRNSTLQEPELPDYIREKALEEMKRFIQVKTWNEYKNL
jgi:hypothetical protein